MRGVDAAEPVATIVTSCTSSSGSVVGGSVGRYPEVGSLRSRRASPVGIASRSLGAHRTQTRAASVVQARAVPEHPERHRRLHRQPLGHGQPEPQQLAVSRGRLRPLPLGDHEPRRRPHVLAADRLRRGRERAARVRLPRLRRRQRVGARAAGRSVLRRRGNGTARMPAETAQARSRSRRTRTRSSRAVRARAPEGSQRGEPPSRTPPTSIPRQSASARPARSRAGSTSPSSPPGTRSSSPGAGTSPAALDWGAGNDLRQRCAAGRSFHMRVLQIEENGGPTTSTGNRELSLQAAHWRRCRRRSRPRWIARRSRWAPRSSTRRCWRQGGMHRSRAR